MKTSLVALTAALVFAAPAFAEEAEGGDTQRDIIVTGTKFSGDFGGKSGIPIERVPQSVQIIGAEDIIEQGATSIGDLLRNVPSASPGYSRVGAYQSFSLKLRGFLADQMRNGIRQRYYEDVDASALSNIERVEVLKGPSGVLYGQSAVGGIISIITKRPKEQQAISMAATMGNYDQKMLTVDMTGGLAQGLSIRVTGEVERSGTFVDFQDMNRLNGAVSLRYAPSDRVTANLVAEYVERDTRRNPGLPIKGTVESNGVGPIARSQFLGEPSIDGMKASAPLVQVWVDVALSDKWIVTPRFQYSEFNTRFHQIRARAPQADLTTINRNGRQGEENDEYYIAQLDISGELNTGGIKHKLLFGFEYDWERGRFTQSNLTNVAPISVLNPVYTFSMTAPVRAFAFDNFYNIDGQALYFQDQIDLTERWNLIGALRHSWIDAADGTFGGAAANQAKTSTTIWQIGSTYKLSDAFSVYAGYNTGFDVESSAAARSANGDPLLPEKSSQAELGLRFVSGAFRGSVSAFEIKRSNALTTDPSNPDFSINVGEQRVRGIEAEGVWQATDWWTLRLGYAWLDSKITKSNDGDQGLRIGDVPRHSFNASTEVQVPGTQLSLRGGVNHVSNRLLVNGSSTVLPAYTLASIGAGYRIGRFSIDAALNNLFDERYFTASGNSFAVYPGDPRTFSLRLGVNF
ncbi:TonB-dependent receptor [Novosphingobium sp.]|uniref:TonB-dependent receptor n=1 Tax=Novosphingobium sp. TaxID=1874826 RepID=UPI0025EFAA61|nr:TonB-dependent receptor [Novosphingobium sp.]MCC6925533.1 TonB-dependent receptor [Novosphingobium sp.]